MIRLEHGEGWLLLPQPAHAWLSGTLAQHWGNERVSCPQPKDAVVLGATLHDVDWYALDSRPVMNDQGEPLSFLQPKLDDVEGMYARTVSQVEQIDPYAGILVNRHVQLIYNSRVTHGTDPAERVQPLLDSLRQQEQAAIERLQTHPLYGASVDEERLHHNYRILRTCDLLSLFTCGGFPPRTLSDVPGRYGEPLLTVECELIAEHTLRITPNVLNVPEVTVAIEGRYIPQKRYEDAAHYAEDFHAAQVVTVPLRVVGEE